MLLRYTPWSGLLFALCWLLAAGLAWQKLAHKPEWQPIAWQPIQAAASSAPRYQSRLIPNAHQASSHSASVVTLPSGDVLACWFAGSREGAKDVQIMQSVFSASAQTWSAPHGILNADQLGEDLGRYIGKIGNPLLFVDGQNKRLGLLFVTVGYGGWAGSRLNVMFSQDWGKAWGKPKRLVTSPFLNVSTLVRNAPVFLEDGSLIVPVYHEFAAQFPELLRLSADGEVLEKVRMHGHGGGIQPSLVQGKAREAYAFMRSGSHNTARRVLRLTSEDEGRHWHDLTLTDLPNPNAAQIVVKVDTNLWIWIGNHNAEHRQDLTLAITHDLRQPWHVVYAFERGGKGAAFSYPSITQGKDGTWHLLYTHNRKHIKHVQFNLAWLHQVMQKAGVR